MLIGERLVPSREVGGDSEKELMWEGKLSETLWPWSICQY